MVVLIEIPFFLSLFVSFYKDCLILKRNDFILIIFQILFQRWIYNKLLQTSVITGISAEKVYKKQKKQYNPKGRIISKRGEGAGNLRKMNTKKKISPLRISPFCCPKLGEDQKKELKSDFVRFWAEAFCPSYKGRGGGHAAFLHTILC